MAFLIADVSNVNCSSVINNQVQTSVYSCLVILLVQDITMSAPTPLSPNSTHHTAPSPLSIYALPSVSSHPTPDSQAVTPPVGPSHPGSSLHRPLPPPVITCCVSGKSNIKAQHGFGTADSCSLSSPTTSTKRQLSSTPTHPINCNTQPGQWTENRGFRGDTYESCPRMLLKDAALLVTTPWSPDTGNDAEEISATPVCSSHLLLTSPTTFFYSPKEFTIPM